MSEKLTLPEWREFLLAENELVRPFTPQDAKNNRIIPREGHAQEDLAFHVYDTAPWIDHDFSCDASYFRISYSIKFDEDTPEYSLLRMIANKHDLDCCATAMDPMFIPILTKESLKAGLAALVEFHQTYSKVWSSPEMEKLTEESDDLLRKYKEKEEEILNETNRAYRRIVLGR